MTMKVRCGKQMNSSCIEFTGKSRLDCFRRRPCNLVVADVGAGAAVMQMYDRAGIHPEGHWDSAPGMKSVEARGWRVGPQAVEMDFVVVAAAAAVVVADVKTGLAVSKLEIGLAGPD